MHRTRINHRRRLALVLVLATGATSAAAPGAWARPGDPPASSLSTYRPAPGQDLRSPDARDAGRDAGVESLRAEQTAAQAAARPVVRPQVTIVRSAEPSGFEWTDAGIGAGAAFAMTMIAAGGLALTTRRRTVAH